jgi:hypothetical protein
VTDDDERFSIVVFFDDGYHFTLDSDLLAKRAVLNTKQFIDLIEMSGLVETDRRIARIIITDSGDDTCFQWEKGKGVTFPPLALD